jgi:hypothetical protein
MASVFADLPLEWEGRPFVIPAAKRLRAIRAVEEVVSLAELYDMLHITTTLRLAAIAAGFGRLLRFAGATEEKDGKLVPVTDEHVFAGLFASGDEIGAGIQAAGILVAVLKPDALEPANGVG